MSRRKYWFSQKLPSDLPSALNFSAPSSGDVRAPSVVDSTKCDIARAFCCGDCTTAGGESGEGFS